MKKVLNLTVIFSLFMFMYPCMLLSADLTLESVYELADRIQFLPLADLAIPTLSTVEREQLTTYQGSLPSSAPDSYDLKAYQTSVKNQAPRGTCQAFAFTGALEAAYIRKYGLNRLNENTDGFEKYYKHFITNDCSLLCITPECLAGCEEFDLSEEYHIHIVFTTDSACNPNINHENRFSYWNGDAMECDGSKTLTGEQLSLNDGYSLPKEKFAPYFGDMNSHLLSYGTNHSFNDLGVIAQQAGIHTVTNNGLITADSDFYKNHPTALTQQEVDAFEYDTRHIPLEAGKNAVYRPTSLLKLSRSDAESTADLEKYISDNKEIEIFVDLAKLDCGDNTYYDNTPVARHSDGHPICRYPVTPPAFQQCVTSCNSQPSCLSSCKGGLWEGYNDSGEYYGSGHAMLIIGYDRVSQLFLLKNSWGNFLSYIWVPYQFIKEKATGGYIIEDVRDPAMGPSKEAMWLGKWDMDYDGHLGTLVVRRTRFRDQSASTGTRMGTFYESDGTAHMVTGSLPFNVDMANLYVDFNNPEPPPFNTGGLDVDLTGQKFQLAIFYGADNQFTYGNFAAGSTNWNNINFGTLLNRQHISMEHQQANSFSINQWKEGLRLFYNDGGEAYLEALTIGTGNGTYYPVECVFNGQVGNYAAIDQEHTNRMFSWGAFPDLYYHTWEKGIVSGIGVFGLPVITVPQESGGTFSYDAVSQPLLNSEASHAKPFAVSHSILLDTVSMQIGFLAFSSPVDIYIGLYAPMISNEIFLISSNMTLQALSSGIVKWKENWTDPIDEKLFQNIFLKAMPEGKYSCYVLVVPAGKNSPGYLWETNFTNPWNTLLLPDIPAVVISQ